MLDYDKTLVLFGRSPFINELRPAVPKIIEKYHTIGCNYFCESFPDVEFVIFYDDIVPKVSENSTIITNIEHFRNPYKKSYTLCHSHKKIEFYTINRVKDDFSFGDSRLNFYIHTPSIALNWAYKKGFRTVILAGVDLGFDKNHFDQNSTPDTNTHTINDSDMQKAREHLHNVAGKYLKIYQLNPNSDMKFEKITTKELLDA